MARVSVPPLRERVDDIPVLAASFIAEQRLATGKPILNVDEVTTCAMQQYPWPGNVRELKAAIEYAVISSKNTVISLQDLPPEIRSHDGGVCVPTPSQPASPPRDSSPFRVGRLQPPAPELDERQRMLQALAQAEGNRARAARMLGISRATFYRRLRALGLPVKKSPPG